MWCDGQKVIFHNLTFVVAAEYAVRNATLIDNWQWSAAGTNCPDSGAGRGDTFPGYQRCSIRTSHCPRAPGQGINLGGGKGGESTFREFYPFQNNVCSSDFNLNGLRVMLLFRVRSLDAYFVFCTCEYGPTAIDAEFGRLRTLMISDQLKRL